MRLGPWELITILSIALLVFGPSKLPTLGKGLGEFLRNFKKSMKDVDVEVSKIPELTRDTKS